MATKAQITWGALAIAAFPTMAAGIGLAFKGWISAEWQVVSGQITVVQEGLKRVEGDVAAATAVAEEARTAATGALTAAATANANVATLTAAVQGAIETQAERDRAQDQLQDLQFGFINDRLDHFGNQIESLREDMEQRASVGEF